MKLSGFLPIIAPCLSFITSAYALALPRSANPAINVVYEFPNNTWVENLAVRSNGKVLVSLITAPEVWEIDPATHTAALIYKFPNAASALGIAEVNPDVFAVAVGNWSDVTGSATPQSWSVWVVDLSGGDNKHNPTGPQVHKATDLRDAQFLNGMTVLLTQPNTVLVGDADKGVIWRVNTQTGAHSIAIDTPDLKPNATAIRELGVNGIHYRNGYVYFVNTFKSPLYSRIPVKADGSPSGPVEVILETATFPLNAFDAGPDDFTLDAEGNAWIATASDTLVKVTPRGKATVIAGGVDSTALIGSTSAAFGRTAGLKKTLYVTSDGGLAAPPPSGVRPGKLWSIDTTGL